MLFALSLLGFLFHIPGKYSCTGNNFVVFHCFLWDVSAFFQSPLTNTTMLCKVFIVELNEACVAAPENK